MAVLPEVTIRAGVRGDAGAITDVQVASWRAGYAHVLPESVLYADDFDGSRRRFWTGWRFAPGHRLAVATIARRVVGFVSLGPERERARGSTGRGEIWAFYLHPDVWGSGIADRLIEHAHERLLAEGFVEAVLWVLDDNPRARRFYERHGWAATGIEATLDITGADPVTEVEYRCDLRRAERAT
jgi:GNAT superfamily N-acetyltransferase